MVKLVSEGVVDSIQLEMMLVLVAAAEVLDDSKSRTTFEWSVDIQSGEVSKVGMNGRNM